MNEDCSFCGLVLEVNVKSVGVLGVGEDLGTVKSLSMEHERNVQSVSMAPMRSATQLVLTTTWSQMVESDSRAKYWSSIPRFW